MTKTKVLYLGDLRTESIHESGAKLLTDAPKDNRGNGEAFSPTDLVAVALTTCVLTLMGIHAKKMGVDIVGATAEVEKEMSLVPPRRISKLDVIVRVPEEVSSEISAENRSKLEAAGLTCPVKNSLHPDTEILIAFQWGTRAPQ
jgi:putative redox protein